MTQFANTLKAACCHSYRIDQRTTLRLPLGSAFVWLCGSVQLTVLLLTFISSFLILRYGLASLFVGTIKRHLEKGELNNRWYLYNQFLMTQDGARIMKVKVLEWEESGYISSTSSDVRAPTEPLASQAQKVRLKALRPQYLTWIFLVGDEKNLIIHTPFYGSQWMIMLISLRSSL